MQAQGAYGAAGGGGYGYGYPPAGGRGGRGGARGGAGGAMGGYAASGYGYGGGYDQGYVIEVGSTASICVLAFSYCKHCPTKYYYP